jgi:multidrug resistance protein MdtO
MSLGTTMPWVGGGGLPAFLQRELAPSPNRWAAAVRVTLACVVCTVPIMVFHLKEPLIVMILMYLVVREDTTTTLLGTCLAVTGATLGCAALLLYYLSIVDLAWLRIISVPAFIGIALFVNRVVALGPIGSAFGIPLALGMVVPDVISSPEYLNRFPFYLWWSIILGLATSLVVQFLICPRSSQSVLVSGLIVRIDAAEAWLRRLVQDGHPSSGSSLAPLALAGTVQQLGLLRVASAFEPALRGQRASRIAQIILTDRLLTAAAFLEAQGYVPRDESERERIRDIANGCAVWRNKLQSGQASAPPHWPPCRPTRESNELATPLLAEIERILELVPLIDRPDRLPEDLKLTDEHETALLVPDAFTNPDYVHFAMKGALGGLICYLAFTLFAYPGIYTAVITCIVCSLSTVGASVQKGVLRFAGAAIGGGLGVITLMYVFPRVDSLGGFWLPFAAVTGLAAYVNFGSARISYCGLQIGVAFYKCVLQGYGPYVELRVARDRLIGIALGLAVFGIINARLWPVKASINSRARLADALRQLAQLAALPDEARDPARRLADAYRIRLQAYRDFASVDELIEGARFEADAAAVMFNEAAAEKAKRLFLDLLATSQHRSDLRPDSVPEGLRTASAHFRDDISRTLTALADRLSDGRDVPMPDPVAALWRLEQAFDEQSLAIRDAHLGMHLRGRRLLYLETARVVGELVALESERKFHG